MLHLFAVDPDGARPVPPPAGTEDPAVALHGPGRAVYTALRTHGHDRFLALDRHLARLGRSAARAGVPLPLSAAALRRGLDAALRGWPEAEARVRLDVRDRPLPDLDARATVFLALWSFQEVPVEARTHGVAVASAPGVRRTDPRTKDVDWIRGRLGQGRDPEAFEHALLDDRGRVLEGFTSNLHLLAGDRVHSPDQGVLRGITRSLVVEVFAAMGLTVDPTPLALARVPELDEAALTSSMRGLVPVVRLDGAAVGTGRPGPVMAEARTRLEARIAREARPAVERGTGPAHR